MFSTTADSKMSAGLCFRVVALTAALLCVWLYAAAVCATRSIDKNKIEKFKFPKQIL